MLKFFSFFVSLSFFASAKTNWQKLKINLEFNLALTIVKSTTLARVKIAILARVKEQLLL
ncbi:hypothetical protein CJP74_02030 [Psittacicella melopsittaci]|uniref:Uncharacterized protein n=1 Tax=Psittacicella melopsittaci TaxID=2028576 RepID=A0A3A1Y835_9GAMM|nr:hypothetical protein CJP74_02030 [Psittacicella melopsittaci]